MDGKSNSSGAIVTGCFVEDMSEMMSDGFFAQSQFSGYLIVGQPACGQAQYLHFSLSQPGGIGQRSSGQQRRRRVDMLYLGLVALRPSI